MARNAAAMPQLVRMNWRRLNPSRLPFTSANSRIRPLEALLRLALRGRKILTVRYDLGRYRRCGRSRFGTRYQTLFPFTEPRTHRHSSLFEPEWLDGNDHVQYRRPDSTGDVKQPDLLRMRPVERTDRVRGGLQQYLAALFGEIRLSLRR